MVEAVFGVEYAGLSLGEGEVGAAFLVGGQFVLERGVQDVETSAAILQGGEGGVVEVVEGEVFGEAAYRRDSAHSKNSPGVEDMEPVRGDAGCAVGDGSGRAERGRMDGRTHDAAVCQPGDQGDNFLLMREALNLRGDFGEVVAGEDGVLVEQQEPGNGLPLGGLQGVVLACGEAGIGGVGDVGAGISRWARLRLGTVVEEHQIDRSGGLRIGCHEAAERAERLTGVGGYAIEHDHGESRLAFHHPPLVSQTIGERFNRFRKHVRTFV